MDLIPIEMARVSQASRAARKLLRPLGIDPLWEPACGSAVGRYAARAIRRAQADAVFVLAASQVAYGLIDQFPTFHCSDATFRTMVGYNDEFTTLPSRALRMGDEIERAVLQRSAGVILSSEWAARSVQEDYGRTHGVYVVPFGANLDDLPTGDVWQRTHTCNLVFIGVKWHEKGGDVALETTRLLNERGIPAILHVVGCEPPTGTLQPEYLHLHGFLRKEIAQEYKELISLISSADFVFIPTRFEAFGIALAEAAAFGTPAVARRTGGVPTVVEDGVTGILLSPDAEPEDYADQIQATWSDPSRYAHIRRNAFARSREILNWDVWAERIEAVIGSRLAEASSRDGAFGAGRDQAIPPTIIDSSAAI
jgi:glycosyltransferase involved in cell wall biosynthesis